MTDLDQLGLAADRRLQALGLTLTQGGEPTFVPHDTSAPEWNVAALGENKLLFARRLARQLAEKLYPGAVLLQSFHKQFPGEPLPRWQIGIYRSRSGGALWKNWNRLRTDQDDPPDATPDQARLLIRRIAGALKLKGSILPVFEDFEAHLRASSDESAARLLPRFSRRRRAFPRTAVTPEEAETHRRHFQPAGWVLPMDHNGEQWRTERWEFPTQQDVTLVPGDSPVGLRLPLKQLAKDALQRAMTVECKDGELIAFLPPLPSFSAFCELVRIVERVATRHNLPPIRLEGYPPPSDPDKESIALMSDPGVIEVNLPPADNWAEFAHVIRGLFTAAETSGLRGHKFQMSGRRVATGGGAHIILGGPDLDRNPFLHCPHLLTSFLRFVQNHPSLSYTFSGLYTGPSCQAPRVDESACELPYELEITLAAMEKMEPPGDPLLMDAMLRNLLMDWNGNTHRAEISVDKFHNQDAPNGRLGLVEFRAFEMMPTADMLLATNVLLRALAAAFAEQRYDRPLIDWKEALHDRFALPLFLRRDLHEVATFLKDRGFALDAACFDAHLDFRFPKVTDFTLPESQWTLRQAIEPWPVMGDHTGTGRIVDGSTDRLELSVTGPEPATRYIVAVNGWQLPLQNADSSTAVAGIRYRLFDNPWGLQPHVQAHSPLLFEIMDAASGTTVHAFEYLNWKRDGSYEHLPNSAEVAAERVHQRLVRRQDLVGQRTQWRERPVVPLAPWTLDLRRC